MKRKITFSIVLGVGIVLALLMKADSSVGAQNQIRIAGDTGVLKLGPGQILRITASPAGGNSAVAFRRMEYMPTDCNGGVCKLAVASQSTTNPTMVASGEGLFYEYIEIDSVRVVVLSNSRDVKVNALIVDAATGKIEVFYPIKNDPTLVADYNSAIDKRDSFSSTGD